MTLTIRELTPADRAEWEPLWRGYQIFYKTDIPAGTTDVTWARFHDPVEPMNVFGAFQDGRMIGIVHTTCRICSSTPPCGAPAPAGR